MNNKLVKVTVQKIMIILVLFFLLVIANQNISYAYVDITGNISEYLQYSEDAPIQGVRVQLINTDTDEQLPPTLTDETGNYTISNVPEGNYKLECRYGDTNVLKEFKNTDLLHRTDSTRYFKI